MFKLNIFKKVLACISCAAMTVGLVSFSGASFDQPVSAKSSSQLSDAKAENSKRINELQAQLDAYDSENKQNEEYQEILSEKMNAQQENLQILNEEINRLKENINEKEESISKLETKIDKTEKDINTGMDNFKERLRAIYVMGNDSLASAVAGSTDFYDLLSKYELISQVANHDNKLVNGLKDELNESAKDKIELTKAKDELSKQQEEKENKRTEMQSTLEELSDDYQNTSEQIESNKLAKEAASSEIQDLEQTNESLEVEIESAQEEESIEASKAAVVAETAAVSAEPAAVNNGYAERITTSPADPEESQTTTSTTVTAQGTQVAETDAVETDATEAPVTKAVQTLAPETTAAQTAAPATKATKAETAAPETNATEATKTEPAASGVWTWPAPASYTISSGFGTRWGSRHAGIDIANGVQGTSAVAAKSGTVIKVVSGCTHNYPKHSSCGCGGGYGNYVVISHGDGTSTLYGHLASVSVSSGQSVSAGQVVGVIGSTGFSTGYHLHFEIRVNGVAVDPTKYLY